MHYVKKAAEFEESHLKRLNKLYDDIPWLVGQKKSILLESVTKLDACIRRADATAYKYEDLVDSVATFRKTISQRYSDDLFIISHLEKTKIDHELQNNLESKTKYAMALKTYQRFVGTCKLEEMDAQKYLQLVRVSHFIYGEFMAILQSVEMIRKDIGKAWLLDLNRVREVWLGKKPVAHTPNMDALEALIHALEKTKLDEPLTTEQLPVQ